MNVYTNGGYSNASINHNDTVKCIYKIVVYFLYINFYTMDEKVIIVPEKTNDSAINLMTTIVIGIIVL